MIAETAARLAASLLSILQNRIELAATEIEEESLRYFSFLLLSLGVLFCAGIAVVLAVMLAVVLFWDTHRVGVLVTLIALFGFAAALVGLRLRGLYRSKPPLLAFTLNELSRDKDMLQPRS